MINSLNVTYNSQEHYKNFYFVTFILKTSFDVNSIYYDGKITFLRLELNPKNLKIMDYLMDNDNTEFSLYQKAYK